MEGLAGYRSWNSAMAMSAPLSANSEGNCQDTCSVVPSRPAHSTKYSNLPVDELLQELRMLATW